MHRLPITANQTHRHKRRQLSLVLFITRVSQQNHHRLPIPNWQVPIAPILRPARQRLQPDTAAVITITHRRNQINAELPPISTLQQPRSSIRLHLTQVSRTNNSQILRLSVKQNRTPPIYPSHRHQHPLNLQSPRRILKLPALHPHLLNHRQQRIRKRRMRIPIMRHMLTMLHPQTLTARHNKR
jgi:hypothetical protein